AQPNLQNLRGMLTTPDGDPLFQVGYTDKDVSSPVTVSADFFGDGGWDTATLGWSPNDGGSLYLVIIRGGDSPETISASSVLLVSGFQLDIDPLPSLSWSSAQGAVVAVFPYEVLYINPVAKVPSPLGFTFPVIGMQVAGFASGAGTDAVLGWSPDRSTWSVITQTAAGSS